MADLNQQHPKFSHRSRTTSEILETRADNLRRLKTLFEIAEGAWAFGFFESVAMREVVIEQLRAALAPLPVLDLSLLGSPSSLELELDALPTNHPAPVVVLHPLPQSEDLRIFGTNLDIRREVLARLPHRLLLCVNEYEWRTLAEHAPNFYSRLSGVFAFSGSSQLRTTAVQSGSDVFTADAQHVIDAAETLSPRSKAAQPPLTPQERRQKITYYHKRIHDLRRLARPDQRLIAEAWNELATLFAADRPNRWGEAEAAYVEAARAYLLMDDPLAEAEARLEAGESAYRNYTAQAIDHLEQALALFAPLRSDERAARGWANTIKALGDVHRMLDGYSKARARYEQALPVYQELGDRLGEANTTQALGDVHMRLSEYSEARERYEQALPVYGEIGDRLGEANTIKALGDVHRMLYEYSEARARYEQALPVYGELGARLGETNTIQALGDVHRMLYEYSEARERYEQALPVYQELGARLGEAYTIQALGDVHRMLYEYSEARARYEQALAVYQELGDRLGEANTIQALGDVHRMLYEYSEARARYEQALAVYLEIGVRTGVANIGINMARLAAKQDDFAAAIEYMQPAADFGFEVGHPLGPQLQSEIEGWRAQINVDPAL